MRRVRQVRQVREGRRVRGVVVAAIAVMLAVVGERTFAAGRASDAIAAAIVERMGADAEVHVRLVTAGADAIADIATAMPDPDARIGPNMWFTLRRGAGTAGETMRVEADVHVIVDHVRARDPVDRGTVLSEADVEGVRSEVAGLPLKRLPALAQVIGTRTLQPLSTGQLVLASTVILRRVVQIGDAVTAVWTEGPVQISATFEAADSGDAGDVIRVVNRDTRRYVRARVISHGVVEVIHVQ